MSYDYNRTAAALPTLQEAELQFMLAVAKEMAKRLPKSLAQKVDVGGQRSYAGLRARGYNASDLEAELTVGFVITYQPSVLTALVEYKDAMMSRPAKQEFSVAYNQNPAKLIQDVIRWIPA